MLEKWTIRSKSSSVLSSSIAQSWLTLCDPMDCSTPGLPIHHHQLPEFTQTHIHWVGDAIQPSHLLSSPSPPPSIFPSIKVFSNKSVLPISIGASASTSVLPMNIQDWFPLGWTGWISLQGTLKSLLQHHSSKASILWSSAFFIFQLSHPYMTIGKTKALTIRPFVGKVTSLLFNTLSRLVIIFLPKSKRLNFMAGVTICSDFGAQENKVWHCFHCFPIYLLWSDGSRCHDLSFLNVEF